MREVREVRIPKGNGRYRVIVVPSRAERARLRELLPQLAELERRYATARGVADVAHGFVAGRSPVTNAMAHVGSWAATITMDLASWFDSISVSQIAEALSAAGGDPALAREITYQGRAAQGLPTSPCAANLCAVPMDVEIRQRLDSLGITYRYTRYADDLTISIDRADRQTIDRVIAEVTAAVAARSWAIASAKTRVYLSRAGRRIVTGVAVGASSIAPTRELRRRLRAARHAAPRSAATHGLAEWAALRSPRSVRRQIRGGVPSAAPPAAPPAAPSIPTARVIRLRRET